MSNSCRLIPTEYSKNYVKRIPIPAKIIIPRDRFSERIEEGELDPRLVSIPTKLDEEAEQLVQKHHLYYQRSVYQVSYKNYWIPRRRSREVSTGEDAGSKEKDFESELLLYIRGLYFNPHDEKVLAPPPTAKRILGYIRPKLLHGSYSMYQDTYGRTGARVMLQEHEKKASNQVKIIKKNDPCAEYNVQRVNEADQ